MPAQPTRRRSDASAGTGPAPERHLPAAASAAAAPARAVAPVPAARPVPVPEQRPVKFTATFDGTTDALLTDLTARLVAEVGRIATRTDRDRVRQGYAPSRADLLRALLEVADDDPSVLTEACAKVRARYAPAA